MTIPSPTAHRIRHLLSIRGAADATTIGDVLDLTPGATRAALAELDRCGHLVTDDEGRYRLTTDGRRADEARTRADRERLAPVLGPVLGDFAALDGAVKEVVTDWQTVVVDGRRAVNRHDDPEHDRLVLDRLLHELHPRVDALLRRLRGIDGRFGDHLRRLDRAADAIRAGDTAMIARPSLDSYHTVWFELHEELLRLTGRSRSDGTPVA